MDTSKDTTTSNPAIDEKVRMRLLEESGCETLLFADGYDDCIIGISYGSEPRVVYDQDKIIDKLAAQYADESDPNFDEEDGFDPRSEAIQMFEYNIGGSYVGEQTPLFITVYSERIYEQ